MEIDKYLNVKYKLRSSQQFDEYLKFIEVNLFLRTAACATIPVVVLAKNGDTYTYTMISIFKTVTYSFKFNQPFIMDRLDGVKVTSLVQVNGNCVTQTETEQNGRRSVHKRIFTPEKLTVITTADGWPGQCVRVYDAIYY